ncbi:DNA-binding helix-turn-helix protein [Leptospira yanagawae serovar Saopaulo str. Sao Paulo = ATCC 700523]|uniref:DNA-binding helix-turn-helix protein n=1 Tax=Leptospira yanagawae serovar Saopaulo str. Sao Paulo = ATCC 700523 TaxID=1249483 RepID=A0A5E8HGE4_9LEPT|nr:helix-turn-helix domain-containing protein [Leptospira yanagawae]EOQ90561.1 DNA-binding helix-turn-helix protein [Leptospira yanagawae serovar Saopaulo str. Sao Paulo = ATCC 700523]
MKYQTYPPHQDLSSMIQCYWTLEVESSESKEKQQIVPDGCMEMAFLLGDGIKRYVSETEFVMQPDAMVIGQITKPYTIEPEGYVNTIAVRFYPYGFSMIHNVPMFELSDRETDLRILFGEEKVANILKDLKNSKSTEDRIQCIESFLFSVLKQKSNLERVVHLVIESLTETRGSTSIVSFLDHDPAKIRDLERKFLKRVGVSPKTLGKVIRLQTALKLMLEDEPNSLTQIAYDSNYYDQSHFIKDFRSLTGLNPKQFWQDKRFQLSTLFYQKK